MSAQRSDQDREELQNLFKIAKAKRSKVVKVVRPLKELCLIKVADSDECAKTSNLPYRNLPPLLQNEILKHMAAQQGSNKDKQTPAMAEWILELVNRLLTKNTKEIDFSIFGRFDCTRPEIERDLRVWQMLIAMCPNLESISDKRRTGQDSAPLYIRCVVPYLKKFLKLRHIIFRQYICSSDDLAQIAEHFPKLESLSAAFEFVYPSTMCNLFLLQNLKLLDIKWNMEDLSQHCKHYPLLIEEQTHLFENFKAECIEHLPSLQYCSGGGEYHNFHPYSGNRKELSLREMEIKNGFDLKLVPFLEKLQVDNVENVQLGAFLSNLTVLKLFLVEASLVPDLLAHCGHKLQALTIYALGSLDPYKVIKKCPQLRKCVLIDTQCSNGQSTTSCKSDVNADLLQYMKHFVVFQHCGESDYISDLLALVLAAPHLETIELMDFNISHADLTTLSEQLVAGCILQSLKTIQIDCKTDEILNFLCLLPVHAPKLELIRIKFTGNGEFQKRAEKSFLFDLIDQIDGIQISSF